MYCLFHKEYIIARQSESLLSRDIIDAVHEQYPDSCLMKIQPGKYMTKGCPDILGVVNSTMVAIEVKMPGREGTVTAAQEKWLERFGNAGAVSILVTSVEDVLAALDHRFRQEADQLSKYVNSVVEHHKKQKGKKSGKAR